MESKDQKMIRPGAIGKKELKCFEDLLVITVASTLEFFWHLNFEDFPDDILQLKMILEKNFTTIVLDGSC